MSEDRKSKKEIESSEEKHRLDRRQFIQWSSLVAGWAALPAPVEALTWADSSVALGSGGPGPALTPTLLEDGGLQAGRHGWEFGEGCRIIAEAHAPSPKVLHVRHRGSSTARAIILSPTQGKTYTLHGYMKTSGVAPLEPGGAAIMSINQFEFQGRPVGLHNFAVLAGEHGWTPFTYTFVCQPQVIWFELSLGLFRAEGEAWFADLTLVEGPAAKTFSEVIPREEEPGYPAPQRQGLPHVAILRDRLAAQGTPSDPEAIGSVLRGAGYPVEYLAADQLSDPAYFTREKYDILVLAYGATFPAPAQKALESFLSKGGSFFSTGGYAFNNPVLNTGSGWAAEMDALAAEPGTELVREGAFDGTLDACRAAGWRFNNPEYCSLDPNQKHQGKQAAAVSIPEGGWWKGAAWEYEVSGMQDRERFVFSCWAKVENVSDRFDGTAYINLEQLDEERASIFVSKIEVVELRGTTGWQRYERMTVASPQTKYIRVSFGLKRTSGKLWVEQVSLRKKFPEIRINTAKGFPNDELRVAPEQIGVFDADYRLKRVAYLAAAPGQQIVNASYRLNAPAAGYAASGVLGQHNARWTPLLNAYDGYGRLRGAAGALMRHYNGVYRKSHWAFFGVEDRDLFPAGDPAARALLLEIFDALRRKTFLHEVQTEYASYRQGESARFFTRVSNFSCTSRKLTVQADIFAEPGRKPAYHHAQEIEVRADSTVRFEFAWSPESFAGRRYEVQVVLEESGRRLDQVETGFLVWDERVLRDGFSLQYGDNYLRANDRAVFLQGSDDYIYALLNRFENPKTWYEDISKYRDHFLLVYENLLGSRGLDDVPPETWWRKLDALLQICQECKMVFFPGLLIFGDTAVENADLKHQQEFCKAFAKRYGLSSGLIYYLNGDLRLRNPDLPDLRRIFNDYLRKKYGDEKRLREAWTDSPPAEALGSIPPLGGTDRWHDMRTADNFWFRVEVVRRWLDSLAAAIREVDQAHPITAEFYQIPVDGIDVVMSTNDLSLGNIGYFDPPKEDIYRYPQTMRFIDMRSRGKSINDGEFGVKTHPAWKDAGGYLVTRSAEEENQYFLAVPHYAAGLGVSKIHNWCWKYPADLPFEWGINYPCDRVSRDALLHYRNTGLFFRQFDFQYNAPEVFFLIADNHRVCGQGELVHRSELNAIRFLIDLHCNFAVTDEIHLNSLPAICKVLFYPIPFCPDDSTFDRILSFVEQGGTLYVSGDISFDQFRKRNRTERLSKLLGVKFIEERYPNIAFFGHPAKIQVSASLPGLKDYEGYPCIRVVPETAEVLARTADGSPVVLTNKVGRGRVFYTTDVPEIHAPARTTDLGHRMYASFLAWAGVKYAQPSPDSKWIHTFRAPTRQGDELNIVVNRDESAAMQQVRIQTAAGPVRVDVARYMTGAIAVTPQGALPSLETSGSVEGASGLYCQATSHVMLFSLDHKDLRKSEAMCLLPMGEGRLQLRSDVLQAVQFEAGEFQNGKWVHLEQGQLSFQNGVLDFPITQDRNLSVLLLARPGKMETAVSLLSKLQAIAG